MIKYFDYIKSKIEDFFFHFGRFANLVYNATKKPTNVKFTIRNIFLEIYKIGITSLYIVSLLSLFMGAVIVIQTASNIDSAFIPKYSVGFTARQSIILEFAPTMISLILAGKIGSNITSEIGSMRLSEQIDALEVMGINSINYLIMPKIIGSIFILPFLVILSMGLGILGGFLISQFTGIITYDDFRFGLQYYFDPFSITYALIKTVFFAFIIASVPSYYGYYVDRTKGAMAIGKNSTKAVEISSIFILLINLIITYFLLL